jgi:hypothetical protein
MAPIISSALFFLLGTAFAAPYVPNLEARNKTSPTGNPSCAPGGNFDLTKWNLQLPTGSKGHVDSVSSDKLAGCKGYTNPDYFYTSKTGALTLKVPPFGVCVTTANSKHCRTELREAKPSSWDPKAPTNRLKVKLAVPQADDSKYGTVVGQIHVDDKISTKPICELFINQEGEMTMGVEQVPNESSLKMTDLGVKIEKGNTFTYEIRYEKGELSVAINDKEFKTLSTGSIKSPKSYFKVGNYNQGKSASEVTIFSIDVQHA